MIDISNQWMCVGSPQSPAIRTPSEKTQLETLLDNNYAAPEITLVRQSKNPSNKLVGRKNPSNYPPWRKMLHVRPEWGWSLAP